MADLSRRRRLVLTIGAGILSGCAASPTSGNASAERCPPRASAEPSAAIEPVAWLRKSSQLPLPAASTQRPLAVYSKEATLAAYETLRRGSSDQEESKALLLLEGSLPRYRDGYVVEGDRTVKSLPDYFRGVRAAYQLSRLKLRPDVRTLETGLRVIGIWQKGFRRLSYAVDRRSFENTADYDRVRLAFEEAARGWEDLCPTCGISFVHETSLDEKISSVEGGHLQFTVRYDPQGAGLLALAFLPLDDTSSHHVSVFKDLLDTKAYDIVGVFRHEIGHILGYRHEDIAEPKGCHWESGESLPVTPYDAGSVMAYFCPARAPSAVNKREFLFSASDRIGHRKTYAMQ